MSRREERLGVPEEPVEAAKVYVADYALLTVRLPWWRRLWRWIRGWF